MNEEVREELIMAEIEHVRKSELTQLEQEAELEAQKRTEALDEWRDMHNSQGGCQGYTYEQLYLWINIYPICGDNILYEWSEEQEQGV
jgi:hypothetical protein